jgi:hypothetical protein
MDTRQRMARPTGRVRTSDPHTSRGARETAARAPGTSLWGFLDELAAEAIRQDAPRQHSPEDASRASSARRAMQGAHPHNRLRAAGSEDGAFIRPAIQLVTIAKARVTPRSARPTDRGWFPAAGCAERRLAGACQLDGHAGTRRVASSVTGRPGRRGLIAGPDAAVDVHDRDDQQRACIARELGSVHEPPRRSVNSISNTRPRPREGDRQRGRTRHVDLMQIERVRRVDGCWDEAFDHSWRSSGEV